MDVVCDDHSIPAYHYRERKSPGSPDGILCDPCDGEHEYEYEPLEEQVKDGEMDNICHYDVLLVPPLIEHEIRRDDVQAEENKEDNETKEENGGK